VRTFEDPLQSWFTAAFASTAKARRIVSFLRGMVGFLAAMITLWIIAMLMAAVSSADSYESATAILAAIGIALWAAVVLGVLLALASALELLATRVEHSLIADDGEDGERADYTQSHAAAERTDSPFARLGSLLSVEVAALTAIVVFGALLVVLLAKAF
jgi:hypothetical protein